MKRIVSLLLAGVMMVSAVPVTYAADTNDYSMGTKVTFTAANNENYTITVPAALNPGQSGTVTLDGYWPDSKTVTVTAEKTVTLKNSIKAADTKTLNVTFLGISEAGSNTSKQTFTEPVSVESISNALFGTWSGKFNYNVDSVEEEVVPPSENYVGTVSADNTITLSGVESAGTYTLRYANANGALENYADICSLEVTDPATAVSYDDLIAENCAPVEATSIAVYNTADEKVGDIALGGLKTNLGTKLYSFGALADVHMGYTKGERYLKNALTYLTQTENVDFIVASGDLTTNASDAEWTMLKNTLDNYAGSTPVYTNTGNHDTPKYRGTDDITDEFLETYTGNPLYYTITKNNDVYIYLGMANEDGGNMLAEGELQWLYETLEANRNKRCFLMTHCYVNGSSGHPNNIGTATVWGGTEGAVFRNLLEHYPNITYFHGHSHTSLLLQTLEDTANFENASGFNSIHVPSLAASKDANGTYNENYSEGYIVDVYENNIILKGYNFVDGKFLPIGQYNISTTLTECSSDSYVDDYGQINTETVDIIWNHNTNCNKSTGVMGTIGGTEGYSTSDLIPLMNTQTYWIDSTYIAHAYPVYVIFYDNASNYVSTKTYFDTGYPISTKLDIPSGATSFRIRLWDNQEYDIYTYTLRITTR